MAFPWTDEHLATAKKLWLEGLSATAIARQIGGRHGLTRSAVLGKIFRSRLMGTVRAPASAPGTRPAVVVMPAAPRPAPPPRPPKPARPPRPVPAPRPAAAAAAAAPRPAPAIPPPSNDHRLTADLLALEQLGPATCRWPIGDPKRDGFGFCGCPAPHGTVYCPEHVRVAYEPITEAKKRATAKLYAFLLKRAA